MDRHTFQLAERLFAKSGEPMPEAVARYFADWTYPDDVEQRIDALSEKANEGTLTEDESSELQAFIALNDLMSVMRLRAS